MPVSVGSAVRETVVRGAAVVAGCVALVGRGAGTDVEGATAAGLVVGLGAVLSGAGVTSVLVSPDIPISLSGLRFVNIFH